MKLGTETGSLMNHVYSQIPALPEPGKGATILHWTDREAMFVNSVSKDGKTVELEYPIVHRIDSNGISECQEYEFARSKDPNKFEIKFKWGAWRRKNIDNTWSIVKVVFGKMDQYHDFSF